MSKIILAIETSCDDTAAALLNERGEIIAESIFSQIKEHAPYGGIVPEIGSRSHIEQIRFIVADLFRTSKLTPEHVTHVASTMAPGLVGPLLVGTQFAKGFAIARALPFVGVHHIEGHIFSGYREVGFPKEEFLALIVSGGHSAIYLFDGKKLQVVGETLDDAAGEAFDKIGRALGLEYPAGKIIDELGQRGDDTAFKFPMALRKENNFNYSFSGLKTHCANAIKNQKNIDEQFVNNFCASLQKCIAQTLVEKLMKAAKEFNIQSVVIGGGVAANSALRKKFLDASMKNNLHYFLPEKKYCTDNAVMIAKAALRRIEQNTFSDLSQDVRATLAIEQSSILYNQSV